MRRRRARDGKFKAADGGTLFLDEIGDMPLALQAKLLRALQEREVEPLGSNAVSRIDVRVIAASSVDLATLVADGRFRSDLYYRLNVLPIRLPPLRERPEDLEALCEHLLEQIALEHEMLPKEIDRDALDALAAMPWPGNVRELRNVLERAAIREALRATGGNRLRAARRLGIARATLYQKLGEFPELAGSAAAAGSGSGKAA